MSHAQQADIEGDARIIGKLEIINAVGDSSIFIGANAGINDDGANRNTFVGNNAGRSNTRGFRNSFFGTNAGRSNAIGYWNSFFGHESGRSNINGRWNSFFGGNAGKNNISGVSNSFFGQNAGRDNNLGSSNSFFGYDAGLLNNTGGKNSFYGDQAGSNNTTGSGNTFIGAQSHGAYDSIIHAIAIGKNALVDCDSCAVIGVPGIKLGIGINRPEAKVHIGGIENESQLLLENGGDILWKKSDSTIQKVLSLHINDDIFFDSPNYFILRSDGDRVIRIEDYGYTGIGDITPTEKLDVDGNARFRSIETSNFVNMPLHVSPTGTLTMNASDIRLKENFQNTDDILDRVLQLKTYTYNFKADPEKIRERGMIAQELEAHFPELVFTNPVSGYKGIHYEKLSVILLKALQEQDTRMNKLEKQVELLMTACSGKSE